jgi:hypothetical protein
MKTKRTVLSYVSGDTIPGDVVNTRCCRCKARIRRETFVDMLSPDNCDIKVLANLVVINGNINLMWLHLCNGCKNKLIGFIKTFLKRTKP